MKQFVKAFNKLPTLSEAKLKEGVFVGPQIRSLFKDEDFSVV